MPFIVGIIAIAAAVYFFVVRARNAASIATELVDVANDVRLAARRFGFRGRLNVHPVEAIEDPNIAVATVAVAFLDLDSFPVQEQRDELARQLRAVLGVVEGDADEMVVLGRWLVSECGGATPAVARASRKLYKMRGAQDFEPLLTIVQGVLGAGGTGLNDAQRDALDDVKRAFRIR